MASLKEGPLLLLFRLLARMKRRMARKTRPRTVNVAATAPLLDQKPLETAATLFFASVVGSGPNSVVSSLVVVGRKLNERVVSGVGSPVVGKEGGGVGVEVEVGSEIVVVDDLEVVVVVVEEEEDVEVEEDTLFDDEEVDLEVDFVETEVLDEDEEDSSVVEVSPESSESDS
jgi:hypothetical protein